MRIWANFYVPNLRYHYKHKKITPNMWFGVVPRNISVDPNIYGFLETLQIVIGSYNHVSHHAVNVKSLASAK